MLPTTLQPQQLEKLRREEGMAKEIQAGNKGYDLLQKMGYQKGMSLGAAQGSGRISLLPMTLKDSKNTERS
jgi:hypothetical protein